jgi:hypothetical protein
MWKTILEIMFFMEVKQFCKYIKKEYGSNI